MRIIGWISLLGAILLGSGCSAIGARKQHSGYFVGTKANVAAITGKQDPDESIYPAVALADFPLSAVADVLLVPYDFARSFKEKPKKTSFTGTAK